MVWDGRDDNERECVNGVYVPIIKARSKRKGSSIYNPTALAWGMDVVPTDLLHDSSSELVSFSVDRITYARIRAGLVEGGPVYASIAAWQLYEPGEHIVQWDGKDTASFQNVTQKDMFSMAFDAFTPPQNSIIITGASDRDQGEDAYKTFPVHPPSSNTMSYFSVELNSHMLEPDITVDFSNYPFQDGETILSGKAAFDVNFTYPENRSSTAKQGSELVLYVDDEFIVEFPLSQMPVPVALDTTQFSNGQHTLTLNLITSDDRVGIALQKIRITN